MDFFLRGTRSKSIATGAFNSGLMILRMNTLLHIYTPLFNERMNHHMLTPYNIAISRYESKFHGGNCPERQDVDFARVKFHGCEHDVCVQPAAWMLRILGCKGTVPSDIPESP